MRQLILAIDFDGTLVYDKWPSIGNLRPNAKEIINMLHDDFNVATILWTCRSGNELKDAINFCKVNDIHFDAFNDNIDSIKKDWPLFSPKIFADFYVDDKAIGGTIDWDEIFEKITEYKFKNSRYFK